MSFYEEKILPHLINCACSTEQTGKLRARMLADAEGEVLEVGMGPGINLQYYNPSKVTKVWGLEPSEGMRKKAQENLANSPVEVEWLSLPGEQIPLDDNSVDTVVLTFTFCTIPDWETAMKQMHRVLKPGGKLIFCEHGQAPDLEVQKWQNRINPIWKKLFGGCNLNRPVISSIKSSGFNIDWDDCDYIEGSPRFVSYMSLGSAVKA
ncbi:MAG: class I SAM-dependent methyltransferase [Pseudomonadales bacterium]|nr:class I SAM-dependent methyltransferase [Pseudomonadales bacterium]